MASSAFGQLLACNVFCQLQKYQFFLTSSVNFCTFFDLKLVCTIFAFCDKLFSHFGKFDLSVYKLCKACAGSALMLNFFKWLIMRFRHADIRPIT